MALAQPSLRRALLAFGLFRIAEMATWIALLVWAFEVGGTRAAGVIAVGQLIPAMLAAPLASVLTDRMTRPHALQLGYLLQAGTKFATAAAVFVQAPFWLVTVMAAGALAATTMTRPVHHALVPELSRSPEELTAGNTASTAVEGIADFVGPAIAAGMLLFTGVGWVFVAMALTGVASLLLARGATRVQVAASPAAPRPYWAEAVEGLRGVFRTPTSAALTAIVTGQFVVLGMLDILAVTLAIDVMGTGPSGPPVITSGLGVGALLGAAVALTLIGRQRLSPAILAGVGVTVGALGLVASSSTLLVVAGLFGLVGTGKAVVEVAARTLLQRSVPPRVLGRILGVQESLMMGGYALGAGLAPLAVLGFGPRGAFLAAAAVVPAIGVLSWAQIRRLDLLAPAADALRLLRSVHLFSMLPAPQLEQLAAALRPVPPLADGDTLVAQGDIGHECFIVVSGSLAIERDGRVLVELGPGEIVGEIALLRDVPRTATARAVGPTELAALDRDPFLLAVTGSELGYRAVDDEVQRRLEDRGQQTA